MHMIVTRTDLGTFAHIHPEPTGTAGVYTVEATFPTAGEYTVHTEFRRHGQMADVLDTHTVTVAGRHAGRSRPCPPATSARGPATASGSSSTATPPSGATSDFALSFAHVDAAGPVTARSPTCSPTSGRPGTSS